MAKLQSLKNRLPKSLKKQTGASAIEYTILVALVAGILFAVFGGTSGFETALQGVFTKISTALGGITITTP